MSKFEWMILVSIFLVGFVVGVLAAPDPCMYPPVERTMPYKHPGIGG